MNITVYLPDELGARARSELKGELSRLVRDAVAQELQRRDDMTSVLSESQVVELDLEDEDGTPYTGRFTGTLIVHDEDSEFSVYLVDDGRVIQYAGDRGRGDAFKYWFIADPEEELRNDLSPGAYARAAAALGFRPIIDL